VHYYDRYLRYQRLIKRAEVHLKSIHDLPAIARTVPAPAPALAGAAATDARVWAAVARPPSRRRRALRFWRRWM
jgi:hypothetical protein